MQIDEDDPNPALEATKIDREDLDRKLAEFREVQSQVEMDVEDDDLAEYEEERIRIEEIARAAKIVLADYIAAHSEESSVGGGRRLSIVEPKNERKMKRPEIQILKFDGDFRKWEGFKNVFESMVVNDAAFTNIEKMVYLKQAMEKMAADVIRKFEITNKSFEKAWSKLKKRYENRRATINTHLQSLTQLPTAKNEAGLQKLLDAASDAIESLDTMGVKNGWSYMVSYLVAEKLDPETRKAWEIETVKEAEYPKYEDLEAFLQQRIRVVESIGARSTTSIGMSSAAGVKKTEMAKTYAVRKSSEAAAERKCFDCAGNHTIEECEKFAARPLAEKNEVIKRKGLCFQCLCRGHMVLACRAPRCSKCSKRHHILLHIESEKVCESGKPNEESKGEKKRSYCSRVCQPGVILPTALVVASQGENKIVTRTFLDSCSEISIVSEYLVKKLKCKKRASGMFITTVNPGSQGIKKSCQIRVEARNGKHAFEADFQIVVSIADDFVVYDGSRIKKRKLDLADDPGIGGSRVDMLIGAEFYEALMLSGRIKLDGEPYLRETVFGWVAIGASTMHCDIDSARCHLTIQDQLQQFFALEEMSTESNWLEEETLCDRHFEATYKVDEVGFVVALPKRANVDQLGESRHIAFRQFCSERRLAVEEFRTYKGFMDEYITLGHLTLIEPADLREFRCYLPHHAVYKSTSTTTRMRSVFNASSPTSSGLSLNDVLMKGPVLQEDLFAVLVRFRCVKVAITADIEKMYRQVRVRKEDRNLQCILWRDSPSEPIRTYELNTVTYGTKPASFLATKCLSKIAEMYDGKVEKIATVLRRDFYMDDVLTGGNSIEEVRVMLQELRHVLGRFGFPLRKFATSSELVLDGLERELIEGAVELQNGEMSIGVLGMRWRTDDDCFVFYARLPEEPGSWTKRAILSEVSRIFDPLGLLAPLVITLKMLLQALWANQLGWDDPVDREVVSRYLDIRRRLVDLPSLRIPRFAGCIDECEIHVFCDASERAYGAAVYLRKRNGNEVKVRLLCAKTRVAPTKRVSLPRLELCGALLAARLFAKVVKALRLAVDQKVRAWSDSTVVLSWIAKPEHPCCAFVANRITKIAEVLPTTVWAHVRSADNAADVISRGIEQGHLGEVQEFLEGPGFLRANELIFKEIEFDSTALGEQRTSRRALMTTIDSWRDDYFARFSSYLRCIRVTAYLLRYGNNLVLEPERRTGGLLTVHECEIARVTILKLVQSGIDKKRLEKVDHLVDTDGLLRLRSRMENAELTDRVKFPILLPRCRFLILLVEHLHLKFFHANCTFLKHAIHFEYFVISNLNRIIRTVVYNCITCRRHAPNDVHNFKFAVGQLPAARVCSSVAFLEVGIDFAGPITTRAVGPSRNRGKVTFKSYIAIFVCMATKACHLEVVEDLSTKAFLDAFSRFVARRGMCSTVYSDHGTNFVGADRELSAAFWLVRDSRSEIENFAVGRGIVWHFIPQRAPNFGGLWEAAVKSFKLHFCRVVGAQILSFVEMSTLVTQIESVLNSRPLCASDSVSSSFLSPSHLCIGRSLITVPEIKGNVVSGSALARYRLLKGLLDRFWALWRGEYLVSLRKATIRVCNGRSPVIGEVVLVKEESTPPCQWPMARISKLYPGKDGIVRVVDVEFAGRILKRPLVKLVPLFYETS